MLISNTAGMIPNLYPDKWWWQILLVLAFIIGISLCFFVILFLFTIILEIVTIPFEEIVSGKTERILFDSAELPGTIKRPFLKQVYFDITMVLKKLFFVLFTNLKNLLWNLIPVAGPVLYIIFNTRDNLTFLGMEFFEPSVDRRVNYFKEKREFARKHRILIMGAGTIQLIMLIIPVLKVLFTPFGVIGATKVFVDMYKQGNLTQFSGGDYGD